MSRDLWGDDNLATDSVFLLSLSIWHKKWGFYFNFCGDNNDIHNLITTQGPNTISTYQL